MAATLPSWFLADFTDVVGGVLVRAANYQLFQYINGTTTNQNTFTDAAGTVPNSHPITLDTAGRIPTAMFLGAGLTYTFVLKTVGGGATVKTWNDVTGLPAALTTPYVPVAGGVTMTGLFTLSGNATGALNPTPLQQTNSLIAASTKTAALVSVADAGNLITATNVETALQEIAAYHGRLVAVQAFTASGTYTRTAGVAYAIVELVGAGAGTPNSAGGKPGGGAGGYSRKIITSGLGVTETVTVGVGAAATAGTSSSFGGHCSATGGAISADTLGGLGGAGSGGTVNLTGGGGGWGASMAANDLCGTGGNSFFGGGAPGRLINLNPGATNGAANTGGGGAGTNSAGGSGLVIVYEFT